MICTDPRSHLLSILDNKLPSKRLLIKVNLITSKSREVLMTISTCFSINSKGIRVTSWALEQSFNFV